MALNASGYETWASLLLHIVSVPLSRIGTATRTSANDPCRRLASHEHGQVASTGKYRPLSLQSWVVFADQPSHVRQSSNSNPYRVTDQR